MNKLTGYFIIIILLTVGVYDLYLQLSGGNTNTISALIITLSHKIPVIPFATGFVMGHLFWSFNE